MKGILLWLDRIFVVIGAIVFMQLPQFILIYQSVLAGHLAEARYQISAITHYAAQSGRTVHDLAAKFLSNSDKDIIFQGEQIRNLVAREQNLEYSLQALENSSVYMKPIVFMKNVYPSFIKETWDQFTWGLPLSLEGGVYACIGMLAGFLFFKVCLKFFNLLSSKKASLKT